MPHLTLSPGGMWQIACWKVVQQWSTSKADMVNYFCKALKTEGENESAGCCNRGLVAFWRIIVRTGKQTVIVPLLISVTWTEQCNKSSLIIVISFQIRRNEKKSLPLLSGPLLLMYFLSCSVLPTFERSIYFQWHKMTIIYLQGVKGTVDRYQWLNDWEAKREAGRESRDSGSF